MKKWMIILAFFAIGLSAFWAKQYYNNRYLVDDYYYTQVPLDTVNEDSYLKDEKGKAIKNLPGKEYELYGYSKSGKKIEVYFTFRGTKENYPIPGAYIQVERSKTITLGQRIIEEKDVPEKALNQIKVKGSKIKTK
ncbi:YxeA family protein [Streptococcus dysgalactiae subsp. equisimilis]|uniref:YxeA family protein n=1 Tax=Streptococcus dysgalactiae TaxID=1334 RepID=UPI003FD8F851